MPTFYWEWDAIPGKDHKWRKRRGEVRKGWKQIHRLLYCDLVPTAVCLVTWASLENLESLHLRTIHQEDGAHDIYLLALLFSSSTSVGKTESLWVLSVGPRCQSHCDSATKGSMWAEAANSIRGNDLSGWLAKKVAELSVKDEPGTGDKW